MYNITVANKYAAIAQSVECILGKDEVTGSNPVSSSKNRRISTEVRRFYFLLLHYSLFTNLRVDFWKGRGKK